ncbi:leucine-rich repeat domain-containing protein [Herbidospora sp. NEAU-GS84]|uniref:Leucine-rich repeat domain-containing protein n=1 Tax=Herbidospora solisilvae TaxID=2696284 RepID=A0A7C9NEF4_9ACTN|nr:STM4015 family protein [Herbidospora solisilvae]NAS20818.1 leucine-rich repeat domain-containing protein [Herbidospora solisilvae]
MTSQISLHVPLRPEEHDDYRERYANLPVIGWDREGGKKPKPGGSGAWYLGVLDEDILEEMDAFFEHVDTETVPALVIGHWDDMFSTSSAPIVAKLTANAHRLPALRALFVGSVGSDWCEISWIKQSDITALLTAFPNLERLEIRGGDGLALSPVRHEKLRMLRIESGGLSGAFVRGVAGCDLPALEHLELWLGVENYGGDYTVEDLAPILNGDRLPALKHLGLQDSDRQDEIAAAVASAPVVARLENLALSMGVLTDEGAEALLSGQPLTHLDQLDLHHHFLSEPMMARVEKALFTVGVDLDERQHDDDGWFYVAVDE